MSRLGVKPIVLPKNIKIQWKDGILECSGAKGSMSKNILPGIILDITEDNISVKCEENIKKSFYGLWRSLINNLVIGVTVGFEKKLRLIAKLTEESLLYFSVKTRTLII